MKVDDNESPNTFCLSLWLFTLFISLIIFSPNIRLWVGLVKFIHNSSVACLVYSSLFPTADNFLTCTTCTQFLVVFNPCITRLGVKFTTLEMRGLVGCKGTTLLCCKTSYCPHYELHVCLARCGHFTSKPLSLI